MEAAPGGGTVGQLQGDLRRYYDEFLAAALQWQADVGTLHTLLSALTRRVETLEAVRSIPGEGPQGPGAAPTDPPPDFPSAAAADSDLSARCPAPNPAAPAVAAAPPLILAEGRPVVGSPAHVPGRHPSATSLAVGHTRRHSQVPIGGPPAPPPPRPPTGAPPPPPPHLPRSLSEPHLLPPMHTAADSPGPITASQSLPTSRPSPSTSDPGGTVRAAPRVRPDGPGHRGARLDPTASSSSSRLSDSGATDSESLGSAASVSVRRRSSTITAPGPRRLTAQEVALPFEVLHNKLCPLAWLNSDSDSDEAPPPDVAAAKGPKKGHAPPAWKAMKKWIVGKAPPKAAAAAAGAPFLRIEGRALQYCGALGHGRRSTVMHCTDDSGGGWAVKRYAAAPDAALALFRELEVLVQLRHSHVLRHLGCETVPQPDAVQVYVANEIFSATLEDWLRHREAQTAYFAEWELLRISGHVLSALAFLHSRSWVHCAVAPAAVACCPGPGPHKFTFKLRSLRTCTPLAQLTHSCALRDCPFPAPKARLPQPPDERVDVWAFGCTLHRLAFLRPYAEGDPLPETPAYSRRMAGLVAGCLHPDPALRLDAQTALHLVDRATDDPG